MEQLQSFQIPNGLFEESTHHTLHTIAHCIAALELFDTAPALLLSYHMEHFGTEEQLKAFLDSLDWQATRGLKHTRVRDFMRHGADLQYAPAMA